MKFTNISKEEKDLHKIFLLGSWIFFSCLFGFVSLRKFPAKKPVSKEIIFEKIAVKYKISGEEKEVENHLDSLNNMIKNFNPENSQVLMESGINYELEEIKRAYEKNSATDDHQLFLHIKDLYSMYFFDKKAASNIRGNIRFLKNNLEECEVGFHQSNNALSIQEALNNNATNGK